MDAEQNNSSRIKLWIIFGLFVGLIIGLIVYEVKQYVLAKEQHENYRSTLQKQSQRLKEVYEESVENNGTQEETDILKSAKNDSI